MIKDGYNKDTQWRCTECTVWTLLIAECCWHQVRAFFFNAFWLLAMLGTTVISSTMKTVRMRMLKGRPTPIQRDPCAFCCPKIREIENFVFQVFASLKKTEFQFFEYFFFFLCISIGGDANGQTGNESRAYRSGQPEHPLEITQTLSTIALHFHGCHVTRGFETVNACNLWQMEFSSMCLQWPWICSTVAGALAGKDADPGRRETLQGCTVKRRKKNNVKNNVKNDVKNDVKFEFCVVCIDRGAWHSCSLDPPRWLDQHQGCRTERMQRIRRLQLSQQILRPKPFLGKVARGNAVPFNRIKRLSAAQTCIISNHL